MRQPLSLRLAIRSSIIFILSFFFLIALGRFTRLYAQSIGTLAMLGIAVSGLISLAGLISGFIEMMNLHQRWRSLLAIGIHLCLLALVLWQILYRLNDFI